MGLIGLAAVVALALVGATVVWPWFRGDGEQALRLPGIVEVQEVRLASKVGGRVQDVMAEEGAMATRGQVLVRLEAPELEARGVRREGGGLVLDDPSALAALGRSLAEAKLFRFRDEPFDIRAVPDGPVLATLDRGVLPGFGVLAQGLHLTGLVERPDGLHLWVGHRADNKLLDPGKLDHLAAGGIAAGHDALSTLEKEGAEECGLTAELAHQAVPVGIISYVMRRPEGLRRDDEIKYPLKEIATPGAAPAAGGASSGTTSTYRAGAQSKPSTPVAAANSGKPAAAAPAATNPATASKK